MSDRQDYFQLGTIVRTHGVKGDMLAALDTDNPTRYRKIKVIWMEVGDVLKEYTISKIIIEKADTARIHLEGIEDMNTAEQYLKCRLFLPLSELPKLRGKKFYFHEVIGFTVVDENAGELGPISAIYDRTEQPVAEFEYQGRKVLFPIHDKIIKKVDRENRRLHVSLPEGLIEIYLE